MSRAVNLRLCEVLGIKAKTCTGFDLRVRHDEMPSLSVHTLLLNDAEIETGIDLFDLVIRPRAFDLNYECDMALARLARSIERSAALACAELRRLEVARAIAGATA